MTDQNTASIVTTAISAAVQLLQAHHAAATPDAPPLTEAQALAALQAAVAQSLARDAQLRQPQIRQAEVEFGTAAENARRQTLPGDVSGPVVTGSTGD